MIRRAAEPNSDAVVPDDVLRPAISASIKWKVGMARSSLKTEDGGSPAARATDEEFIPSLEKGLAVLELFSSQYPEWTLTQISRELKITPGSTRRILRTLELLGYAVPIEGRFQLTPRVLRLGFSYLSSQPFAETAQPLLRELATRLNLACSIAVLHEREVVYLARASYKPFEPYYVHVGARFPAYATSPGKVLLSGLPQDELKRRLKGWKMEAFTPNTLTSLEELKAQLVLAKERGWAISDQEIFLGHRSIAVPLFVGGVPTAAVVAATSVSRASTDALVSDLLPPLLAAAAELQQIASVLL